MQGGRESDCEVGSKANEVSLMFSMRSQRTSETKPTLTQNTEGVGPIFPEFTSIGTMALAQLHETKPTRHCGRDPRLDVPFTRGMKRLTRGS